MIDLVDSGTRALHLNNTTYFGLSMVGSEEGRDLSSRNRQAPF